MHTPATPEHDWLRRLVGEWTFVSRWRAGPDGEPGGSSGHERVRAIGDLWVVGESTGEMPGGGTMTSVLTLGHDPAIARFIGTWIGSPMAFMFRYEGVLDDARRVLTLDTSGPDMASEGATARYQDIVELTDDGRGLMRSRWQRAGGDWVEFMEAEYTRVG